MSLPWPHHPSDPVPLPSALSSVLGQRCRDLLLQLYLQRPEVRVPVPEVLLQSEGATSSSICKVRDTVSTEQGVGAGGWGAGGGAAPSTSPQGEGHSPHRAWSGGAISLTLAHLTRARPYCARLFLWMQLGAEGCPFPFLYPGCGQTGVSTCVSCGQYGAMASITRVVHCHPRVPQRSPPPTHSGQLHCASAGQTSLRPLEFCVRGHMSSCLWCDR